MIRIVLTGLISTVVGFLLGIYYSQPLSDKFMEVRLFEIIQLFSSLIVGVFISYFLSQKLSNWGKRSQLIYDHLTMMLTKYSNAFEKIDRFTSDPKSILTKEITLIFKELSSNIATLEKHHKDLKLDAKELSSIRESHDKMNELIVNDKWGIDSDKMSYSNDDKNNVRKEYSITTGYIENLRFELYK